MLLAFRGVSAGGIAALEDLTLNTHGLDGVVLRYGHFYGPDTWSEHGTPAPSVHVDAAARAVVLALERRARGIFNIAEPNALICTDRATCTLGWDWRFRIAN
jgi:nucleoside-diphosphate-sugar epimerase